MQVLDPGLLSSEQSCVEGKWLLFRPQPRTSPSPVCSLLSWDASSLGPSASFLPGILSGNESESQASTEFPVVAPSEALPPAGCPPFPFLLFIFCPLILKCLQLSPHIHLFSPALLWFSPVRRGCPFLSQTRASHPFQAPHLFPRNSTAQ